MLIDEFNEQVKRLKEVYGDKIWNQERLRLLYQYLGKEPVASFQRALDSVIGECNVSPAFSKIGEFLGPSKYKELKRWIPDWDCSWCGQVGLVSAKVKDKNYHNLFICPCEFGRIYAQGNVMPWNNSAFPNHTIDPWAKGIEVGSEPHKIKHKVVGNQIEEKRIISDFIENQVKIIDVN